MSSRIVMQGRGTFTSAISSALFLCLFAGPSAVASTDSEFVMAPLPSPEVVTLERLLNEALRSNPGLRAKRRAYEAARARVFSAWLPNDPEIGTDVEGQSQLFRFDRTDNEYSIVQTVPFPTTLILKGQIAAKDAQIAYQQYKEEERKVLWHIEQPYYELFLAKRTRSALEETQGLAERLTHVVQARYESNQAGQQDLLKASIESSKIGIERYQWNEHVHLAQAHLSHVLDRPLETSYEIPEVARSPAPTFSTTDLEQLAIRVRPELKALELGIRRAKASRLLAATTWLPDLTGRIEARQFSGQGHVREYDTFLGITVPVWSLVKGIGGGWKGAGLEVQAAEASYAQMKNDVLLAIHEAYATMKTADNAVTTYEQSILPQAKQQAEVALASYEAGRSDLLSLIDAQRMLKDAQIAYYKFLANYELGLSDLRVAIGERWEPTIRRAPDATAAASPVKGTP